MELDNTGKTKDGGNKGAGLSLQQPGGQTSSVEQLTSGIEEGKQYAGKDVLTLVQDALSADGREQKDRAVKAEGNVTKLTGELNTLTANFETLNNQMAEITRTRNEAELAQFSEDKPAQDSLRVRQANTAERIRLEGVDSGYKARETKLVADQAEVAKKEVGFSIKLAAMAAGVDETRLANLVPDGDPGRLTEAATLLKGTVAPEIDPKTNLPKPPGLTTTPATLASVSGDARSVSEVMLQKAKSKA